MIPVHDNQQTTAQRVRMRWLPARPGVLSSINFAPIEFHRGRRMRFYQRHETIRFIIAKINSKFYKTNAHLRHLPIICCPFILRVRAFNWVTDKSTAAIRYGFSLVVLFQIQINKCNFLWAVFFLIGALTRRAFAASFQFQCEHYYVMNKRKIESHCRLNNTLSLSHWWMKIREQFVKLWHCVMHVATARTRRPLQSLETRPGSRAREDFKIRRYRKFHPFQIASTVVDRCSKTLAMAGHKRTVSWFKVSSQLIHHSIRVIIIRPRLRLDDIPFFP